MFEHPKRCLVYVIAKMGDSVAAAPVKVGISGNVEARVCQIQGSCPFQIAAFYQFSARDRRLAGMVEATFHHENQQQRLWGEWFDLGPGDAVARLCGAYRQTLREYGMGEGQADMELQGSGVLAAEQVFGREFGT